MAIKNILSIIITNYVFRRFLFFLLIIWIASTAIFLIPRLSGQDPVKEKLLLEAQRGGHMQAGLEEMAAEYSRKFGLDKPLIVQYGNYMADLVRFDFGPSIAYFPKSVNSLIGDSVVWTFGLLSVCTFLAFFIGRVSNGSAFLLSRPWISVMSKRFSIPFKAWYISNISVIFRAKDICVFLAYLQFWHFSGILNIHAFGWYLVFSMVSVKIVSESHHNILGMPIIDIEP